MAVFRFKYLKVKRPLRSVRLQVQPSNIAMKALGATYISSLNTPAPRTSESGRTFFTYIGRTHFSIPSIGFSLTIWLVVVKSRDVGLTPVIWDGLPEFLSTL